MNVSSIRESDAFNEGAKLWIIKNDPNLFWWKKLDIHSKYLLSENFLKKEKSTVFELQTIINATNLKISKNSLAQNHLLLGTEDHFLNKWILLWNDLNATELADLICETTLQLKVDTLRLFSDQEIIYKLETRPTASLLNITYIENL